MPIIFASVMFNVLYYCKTFPISSTKCTSYEISKTFGFDQSFGLNKCPRLQGFCDNC